MESPADDDICILNLESGPAEGPLSVCAGDESVASHFALVTAYEDIKKRLRDSERENGLLRRRVRLLEDKHVRPEAPPSEGPQYMNKAFSAYRGIYIQKEDLQLELNRVKREKSELEKVLMEQLQAKELEILQLKSELETSQVMKSLSAAVGQWQLEEHTEYLQLDSDPVLRAVEGVSENGVLDGRLTDSRLILTSYQDVLTEATRLHSLVRCQSELMRRIRERAVPLALRRASAVPVQCLDDVERNNSLPGPSSRPPSAPPLPCGPGSDLPESLQESRSKELWALPRPAPPETPMVRLTLPQRTVSLDDSSWSFPGPPRPSEALFWDDS